MRHEKPSPYWTADIPPCHWPMVRLSPEPVFFIFFFEDDMSPFPLISLNILRRELLRVFTHANQGEGCWLGVSRLGVSMLALYRRGGEGWMSTSTSGPRPRQALRERRRAGLDGGSGWVSMTMHVVGWDEICVAQDEFPWVFRWVKSGPCGSGWLGFHDH
jgi:hypothetical protein